MFPSPERATRVLIVDDDPMMRELLATRLGIASYAAFHASDGREGLCRCAEVRPGAVILDINMPRLDGFGFLEGLPSVARTPPHVMVLTARNQMLDVRRAIQLGAQDFLAKPFGDAVLLARVARLLRTGSRPQRPVQLLD